MRRNSISEDEKYYLSNKMIDYISSKNEKWTGNNDKALINKEIVSTINTGEGSKRCDASNYICKDLPDNADLRLFIKSANLAGYMEAKEGDGIDICTRMEYHRGTVQDGKAHTLTTEGGNNEGVVVKDNYIGTYNYAKSDAFIGNGSRLKENNECSETLLASGNQAGVMVDVPLKRGYSVKVREDGKETENVDIIGNYSKSNFCQTPIVSKNGVAPTFTENHGQVTAITEDSLKKELCNKLIQDQKVEEGQMATTTYPNGYGHGSRTHNESIALNTIDRPSVKQNLRIRKLTPCECIKLMAFEKKDYEALRQINMTDSAIYHMAGDSICVNALCGIFGQMVDGLNVEQTIKDYVKGIVENDN